jgi:hypothetical protein
MPKITSRAGPVTVMLLFWLAGAAGCAAAGATPTANASPSPIASAAEDDAASWCASAAGKGLDWSLRYSVTSTLAGVQAWRDEQGRAGRFQEQLEARFPVLARLGPSDPLGVCLFVHAPRPIPVPPGANITADGTRAFVTPDGIYVEDAIGDQAVLLEEMSQIH